VEAKIEKANPGESPADEPAKQLEEEDPAEPVSMDGFKSYVRLNRKSRRPIS
jgi:hypothetical protein